MHYGSFNRIRTRKSIRIQRISNNPILKKVLASEELRCKSSNKNLLEISNVSDNPRHYELLVGEALSLEDERFNRTRRCRDYVNEGEYLQRLATLVQGTTPWRT